MPGTHQSTKDDHHTLTTKVSTAIEGDPIGHNMEHKLLNPRSMAPKAPCAVTSFPDRSSVPIERKTSDSHRVTSLKPAILQASHQTRVTKHSPGTSNTIDEIDLKELDKMMDDMYRIIRTDESHPGPERHGSKLAAELNHSQSDSETTEIDVSEPLPGDDIHRRGPTQNSTTRHSLSGWIGQATLRQLPTNQSATSASSTSASSIVTSGRRQKRPDFDGVPCEARQHGQEIDQDERGAPVIAPVETAVSKQQSKSHACIDVESLKGDIQNLVIVLEKIGKLSRLQQGVILDKLDPGQSLSAISSSLRNIWIVQPIYRNSNVLVT